MASVEKKQISSSRAAQQAINSLDTLLLQYLLLVTSNTHLVYDSGQKKSNLHEHKVGCGIEIWETGEGKIVVETVESRWHQVEQQHVLVGGDTRHQGRKAGAGK